MGHFTVSAKPKTWTWRAKEPYGPLAHSEGAPEPSRECITLSRVTDTPVCFSHCSGWDVQPDT